MLLKGITHNITSFRPAAYLEVDTDPKSERLQVFDRLTGEIKSHVLTQGGVVKIILAKEYAYEPNLMCTLLDDDEEYGGEIVDKVQCILIDLNSFDVNNPLPYEPPP